MMKLLCVVFILGLFGFEALASHATDTLQFTISWKNVDSTRKIRVEKGPTTTGPWSLLADLDANTTSYVDATNMPGTKACYRIGYFDAGTTVVRFSTPKCKTFTMNSASPPTTVGVR